MDNTLRIRRYNKKNLVIESKKQTTAGSRWVVTGYYGTAWGMASGLVDMLADSPENEDLTAQVDQLMALIDERTERIARALETILERDPDRVIEIEVSQ